jgi:transcriptional repressor NrdR
MVCPYCTGEDTRVVDSRSAEAGVAIRRRRECAVCGRRFTTYERPATVHFVRKRDGRLEPFDPAKPRGGVERALADRTVPEGSVDALLEDIVDLVSARAGETSTDEIGQAVLARLREIDHVAYLRFASVYKDFQGAGDFERELAALERER